MVDGLFRRSRRVVQIVDLNRLYIHRTSSLIDYMLGMWNNGKNRVEGFICIADTLEDAKWCNGDKWYAPIGGIYLGYLLDQNTRKRVSRQLKWNIYQVSYRLIHLVNTLAITDALRMINIDAVPQYLNDVVVGNKKIGSVTIRYGNNGRDIDYIVVQLAVNVNNSMKSLPEEYSYLKEKATSVIDILSRFLNQNDRSTLIKTLIAYINHYLNLLMSKDKDGREEIAEIWSEYSGLKGKHVKVLTELGDEREGKFVKLSGKHWGGIILENENGELDLIMDGCKMVEKKP